RYQELAEARQVNMVMPPGRLVCRGKKVDDEIRRAVTDRRYKRRVYVVATGIVEYETYGARAYPPPVRLFAESCLRSFAEHLLVGHPNPPEVFDGYLDRPRGDEV
ncbi:MAG: hypothetical protein AAFQ53_16730, partial [Bacteroidota bacterium]